MARRHKRGRFVRAILWVVTFVCLTVLSSSVFSIFNNQADVAAWIWWSAALSTIALIVLITYRLFTTNETIAFSFNRR